MKILHKLDEESIQTSLRLPARADVLPARRLIAAVLHQACKDARLGGPIGRDAIEWIFERQAEWPWSFEWCCQMVGANPVSLRRSIWRSRTAVPDYDARPRPGVALQAQ